MFLISFGINQANTRISKITNLITGHETDYFYNIDGRIRQIRDLKGRVTNFVYTGDKIIKTYGSDEKLQTDTFFINEAGLAGDIVDARGTLHKYRFSKDSFATDLQSSFKGYVGSTSSSKIVRGNITQGTAPDGYGKMRDVYYYDYYPNTVNTIGNENMGMIFRGKSPVNLESKSTHITEREKDTTIIYDYYRFDEMGRVSLKTAYRDNKLVDSIKYDYY